MLLKTCIQYQQKLSSGHSTGKSQISSQLQRKAMSKNVQTTILLHSSHMSAKSNAQNSPSQSSILHKLRTSRYSSWILKRQRNQSANCQHPLDHRKSKTVPEKNIYFCFIDYVKAFDCVDHNILWKILKEIGIPDHLTCLLRSQHEGKKQQINRHGTD